MEPNREVTEYWATLAGLTPLALIGAIVAIITSAKKLYELPTGKRIAVELLVTFMVGAAAALVAVGLLPLMFGHINPKIEIGVAGLAGSFGQKSFDVLLNRLNRLGTAGKE